MKIFAQRVLQPGGAAIIFPKNGRNQNRTLVFIFFSIVNTRNLEETKNSYLQNGAFEKNFNHRT